MGERNGRDHRQIPPKLLVHTRIRGNRVESADREEYFSHLYTTELTFSQVPKPMPLFNVQCQNSCVPIPTHFFEEKGKDCYSKIRTIVPNNQCYVLDDIYILCSIFTIEEVEQWELNKIMLLHLIN
jgi:hypothetical protein